jgi:peroxiredoxin
MRALLVMVLAIGLTACSSARDEAGSGFVSGDGSLAVLAPDDRLPAPDVSGTTLDGETLRLSDFRGDVVVLNVWASWCAPCRAEAPALNTLSEELADQGVQFIGLNTRDSPAAAEAFVANKGVPYPSLVDSDGRIQVQFVASLPPQAIPSTVVIDREGRVAARALGKVSESDLRGLIEPMLQNGESP